MSSCLPGPPPALREPPLVLLLGDGDLGYAAALCTSGEVLPGRLVATTLEKEEELLRRYVRAGAHLDALGQAGALVLHSVDATSLAETLLPRLPLPESMDKGIFSLVRFNFPHRPGGLKSLRGLLGSTMAAVAPLLAAGGELQVALLAGQAGTPADGERLRPWGDNWHCTLLGARAGLALARVDAWTAPRGYVSQREQGNRDSGGKEKSFYTDGALVHVFVPHASAALPSCVRFPPAGLLGGCIETRPSPSKVEAACEAFEDALVRALRLTPEQLDFRRSAVAAEGSVRFGPRDPAVLRVLEVRAPVQATADGAEALRLALERASRAAAGGGVPASGAWRWASAADAGREQLEVYWERQPSTVCFPCGTASPTRGDWLVAAWISSVAEESTGCPACEIGIDLEVLMMLRCGIHDRRLLDDERPDRLGGDGLRPAPLLYPCLYVHDLRVGTPDMRTAGPGPDPLGAAVVKELRAACGSLLLEAYELPAEGLPEGERRWRLALQSPDLLLDDRTAYAAYQAARERVRENLGLELR